MSVCFRCYRSTSPTVKGNLFWDTGAENMGITSGKLSLHNIELSTMTFTLPMCHPNIPSVGSDELYVFLNLYRVRNGTEALLHRAYVSQVEFDIDGNATYTCADVFGLCFYAPGLTTNTSTTNSIYNRMKLAIADHNWECFPAFEYYGGVERRGSTTISATKFYPQYADGSTFPTRWDGDNSKFFRTLDGQEEPIIIRDSSTSPVSYRSGLRVLTYLWNWYHSWDSSSWYDPQETMRICNTIYDPAYFAGCANSQLLAIGKNVITANMTYAVPEYNSIYATNTRDVTESRYSFDGDNRPSGSNMYDNTVFPGGTSDPNLFTVNKMATCIYDPDSKEEGRSYSTGEELEALARTDITSSSYASTFDLSVEAIDLGYVYDDVDFFDIHRPMGIEHDDTSNDGQTSVEYFMADEYNIDFVNPTNSKISANISPRITR